ncbi:hypothetical protein TWF696_008962 [Orbilia brochopaga]|uniref:Uncharacterized protein n=1 Tax=Orbilia brochopaga TaxID=3140254 RepID=A0AAV9UJA1_9PEZI
MTVPNPLAVMRFRQYTASEPYDHTGERSVDRAKIVQQSFQYQLKYKRGDDILIPVDNLGFEHPVGVNETNGQVGNIQNLDHLRLDLDRDEPPTRSYQIHGIIDAPDSTPFKPNDYEHLNKPPREPSPDAVTSRWQYSFGEPFLLRPVTNEQLKNQTEQLVHLFNLRTGEPISAPIATVQLFPNFRYVGTVPVLDPRFSGSRAAFTCGQLVTAATFGRRSIRLGHRDSTNSVYCIGAASGAAAWVLEDKLEAIEYISLDEHKQSFPWTDGTLITKKRRQKLLEATTSNSPEGALVKQEQLDSGDEGYPQPTRALQIEGTNKLTLTYIDNGEDEEERERGESEDALGESVSDRALFDENANPYYDDNPSPASIHEGEDDLSLAPLRVKQEDLGNGQGLRTRISIDRNRPQTPDPERRRRRDQAMLDSWHQRKSGGEEHPGRQRIHGRHRRVQAVAMLINQMGVEQPVQDQPMQDQPEPSKQQSTQKLLTYAPDDDTAEDTSAQTRYSTPVTDSSVDTPVLSARACSPFDEPDLQLSTAFEARNSSQYQPSRD